MDPRHPSRIAYERQRWLRHDWKRWMRSESALSQNADGEFAKKYSPDQPRVPAGNPDGGRWAGGNAGSGLVYRLLAENDRRPPTANPVLSDASPDPIRPGAQLAQLVERFDLTGEPAIDRTSQTLMETLARAHAALGTGAGPLYGTMIHSAFATDLRLQNLPGIEVEQSFSMGDVVKYGLDGSIRTDVIQRDPESPNGRPIAIWDVKTGDAKLTSTRVQEIRDQVDVGREVPVLELHIRRGVATKGRLGRAVLATGFMTIHLWH